MNDKSIKKNEKGTVKWFNMEKGFGFIETNKGVSIFVHYSNINKNELLSLNGGEKVEFDLVLDGPKGPQAINVEIIEDKNNN